MKYAVRLKINKTLLKLTRDEYKSLTKATRFNMVDYVVTYGGFYYQASSWREPRRVVFKIELLKVVAKIVHTGRYIKFKLCSSCPYKAEAYETFENIWQLAVQPE